MEPVKAIEVIRTGYLCELSTKTEIALDPSELDSVLKAIATGGMARVRQGIINPSYVVCIREDKHRRELFVEDTKYDEGKRSQGMRQLKDIFADRPMLGTQGQAPRIASQTV